MMFKLGEGIQSMETPSLIVVKITMLEKPICVAGLQESAGG